MSSTLAPLSDPWPTFPKPASIDGVEGLTPKQLKEIKTWTLLTDVLAALAGACRGADDVVQSKLKSDKDKRIADAALRIGYAVMRNADLAIADEITAIKTGTVPVHTLPPVVIPPWNPDAPPQTLFQDIWQGAYPALNAAYQAATQVPHMHKLAVALYAVIQSGKQIVTILHRDFPKTP